MSWKLKKIKETHDTHVALINNGCSISNSEDLNLFMRLDVVTHVCTTMGYVERGMTAVGI